MKKKITAFIIGAAIWFGMADAARQMDSLQSGASDLVAKTSMFLFSLGREANAPAPDKKQTNEPFNAASTENALTAGTKTRGVENPKAFAKTNAAKRENVAAANHSEEETFEPHDSIVRVKDVNALIALSDEFDADVHSQEEARVNALASLTVAKDGEIRQRAIMRKTAAMQRMAVEAGKRYEVRYSFDVDEKATKSTMPATTSPKSSVPCPPLVSPDVRKLKTVLLVPEVMKQFGE